jgi:hypothetical protein
MAWKGLFQHLEGHLWTIIMNLCMPMKFKLRNGGYIGLPIMFLSLRELWPQLVQWQLLTLIQ